MTVHEPKPKPLGRNPEVGEPRDKYDREQGRTVSVRFWHGATPRTVMLTRDQAEALLHQLETHLYGGVDAAGYTKLSNGADRIQLSPAASAALRQLNTPNDLSTDVVAQQHNRDVSQRRWAGGGWQQ